MIVMSLVLLVPPIVEIVLLLRHLLSVGMVLVIMVNHAPLVLWIVGHVMYRFHLLLIVMMDFVIMVKHVPLAQVIADHVLHLRPIVEMVLVMLEKVAHPALEIVAHVLLHLLQRNIVEMGSVTMGKIVVLVQMIVLEPIHATIVLLQLGKHLLG